MTPDTEQTYHQIMLDRLWLVGDWAGLLQFSKIRTKTDVDILYQTLAELQVNGTTAHKIDDLPDIPQLQRWFKRALLSGAANSLARAYSINGEDKAEELYKQTVEFVTEGPERQHLANWRATEQRKQLGLTTVVVPETSVEQQRLKDVIEVVDADNVELYILFAEHAMRQGQWDNAIRYWQHVVELKGVDAPQAYYDRLKLAYQNSGSFPVGSEEQEALKGSIDKHRLLKLLHDIVKPRFYFEVGVQTGKSLALANCEAMGIDPMPLIKMDLPETSKVIATSSDAFFVHYADELRGKSIDLVFIDGMHLFEYALRDFINVEHYAHPDTVVVIDDILPCHPDQAKRERCTRAWTGDVWKVKAVLEKYRPDLKMMTIDAYPTGLLMISNLQPGNATLLERYETIVAEYQYLQEIPESVLERKDAVTGEEALVVKKIKDTFKE